ncbi:hypothetical protein HDU78_011768, partial [Chytriomyces hyalinus]
MKLKAGQPKFKKWLDRALTSEMNELTTEYTRLTNLAFGVSSVAPLVFLFDEMQVLCTPTELLSKV